MDWTTHTSGISRQHLQIGLSHANQVCSLLKRFGHLGSWGPTSAGLPRLSRCQGCGHLPGPGGSQDPHKQPPPPPSMWFCILFSGFGERHFGGIRSWTPSPGLLPRHRMWQLSPGPLTMCRDCTVLGHLVLGDWEPQAESQPGTGRAVGLACPGVIDKPFRNKCMSK